ncbi:AbrB/MazE/SpoVT family DNA-binding domain-containing protein [Aerophototrophica crusticola]|uniref:AbrB/MazE/SpoVT family DNA-binding domain-containing protein n=1 Tax=Aerophototrophica crusticola TaxID=1709002 RepID=A0A858R7R0_9PROT|nr:AbrB/MazE/SpoVT family DNA-binding domain-containing protein [Rhodospirillaceae bacterium B3]
MGIMLTVTAKGQVTLRKEVLEHLGAKAGDKLEIDLLPGGRMQVRAKPTRPISDVFGMLKRPGQPTLTVEEMNDIIAAGWAGER